MATTRRRVLLLAVILGLLAAVAFMLPHAKNKTVNLNETVNPDGYVKENDISVTGYYQGDATVYSLLYQESAEVAAMQMQAYSLARIRADEAMADNGGTGEGLAIVTDIDSTIADDTCYIAGAVLDAAGRMSVEYFGDMLEPWVNDDWCGYYEAIATEADTVIPGAKEFMDYTYENGFEWYYITNRPYYELDLTVQQLYKQGFLEKAPKGSDGETPDLVEDFAAAQDYQEYYYYGDEKLATLDETGNWYNVYGEGTYGKEINDTGVLEMSSQSFSVKDDYRVQVQGSDFDSDKSGRRANVAKVMGGYENIVLYLGDSINDMVSDYESEEAYGSRWFEEKDGEIIDHSKDFTKKQYNEDRTKNASSSFWKDHWGKDFIVLPNATYGDWYKATWAKGTKDEETGLDSSTPEGQQQYIYNQIWAHSYKNPVFGEKWYHGPSPVTNDVQ